MKLPIEKWVENNGVFNEDEMELYKESVQCYKVGAYKSAFIMSYLAFKLKIRNRILECNYIPPIHTPQSWKVEIIEPLESDGKWESMVNSIVKADARNSNLVILTFSNRHASLIDFDFWREKRNKCVHAKEGIIDSSTVECFWSYVRDNISKFYVLGGEEYIQNELLDYYQHRFIKSQTEKQALIDSILVVFGSKSEECLTKFVENYFHQYHYIKCEDKEFWSDFINSTKSNFQDYFVQSIMSNVSWFIDFYALFPQLLDLAVGVNSAYIIDKISPWLYSGRPYSAEISVYWDLLYRILQKYPDNVDVDKIVKHQLCWMSEMNLSDDQIKVFGKYEIFNKFFLSGYFSYFFDFDYESILKNNGSSETEAFEWIQFITWTPDIIVKISYALSSINLRVNNSKRYLSMEIKRIELFEYIIKNHKDEIKKIVNDQKLNICNEMTALL